MKKRVRTQPAACRFCVLPLPKKTFMVGYHDKCVREVIHEGVTNQALAKAAVRGTPSALRLRMMFSASFTRSDSSNYDLIRSRLKRHRITLGPRDVVAFRSLTGAQVMFVYAPTTLKHAQGEKEVLRSVRFRLRGPGAWNPEMLANYARDCGIQLEGLKHFEEYHAEIVRDGARVVAKRLGVSDELPMVEGATA